MRKTNKELDAALSDAALAAKLAVAKEKLDEARQEYAHVGKLVSTRHSIYERLTDEQNRRKIASDSQPDWDWLFDYSEGEGGMTKYEARKAALHNLSPNITASGYNTHNMQSLLDVMLNRESDIDAVETAIRTLLPVLKPVDDDGIYISVMTDDLSESGILHIRSKDKQTFDICKTVYGSTRDIMRGASLREVLERIAHDFSYEYAQ